MFGLGDREVTLLVAASLAVFTGIEVTLASSLAHVLLVLRHADAARDGFVRFQLGHRN